MFLALLIGQIEGGKVLPIDTSFSAKKIVGMRKSLESYKKRKEVFGFFKLGCRL